MSAAHARPETRGSNVTTHHVIAFLTGRPSSGGPARALAKFAHRHPADFDVLASWHTHDGRHASVAAVLVTKGAISARDQTDTAELFRHGLAGEAMAEGCEAYADALLRLDAWLAARAKGHGTREIGVRK